MPPGMLIDVSPGFAGAGAGGRYVGVTVRDKQYARVVMSLILLSKDIEEKRDQTDESRKAHDVVKGKILADASDYVSGSRPEEDGLSPDQIKDKQFRRLQAFVDYFIEKLALEPELYRDLVVKCATDMGIVSSRADLERLRGNMLWHTHEPINEWFDARLPKKAK